jgi:hypothetical protein
MRKETKIMTRLQIERILDLQFDRGTLWKNGLFMLCLSVYREPHLC